MNYNFQSNQNNLVKLIEKYELELEHRIKSENEINMIAKMLTFPDKDNIYEILKILGKMTKVDRTYIFEFKDNLKFMDNTYEWTAKNADSEIENLKNLPSDLFPWWMKKLKNNEVIVVEDIEDIPPEGNNEKEMLKDQSINSLLVIPLYRDELKGFIGFDDTRNKREWNYADIELLNAIGNLILAYWDNIEKTNKLHRINKELSQTISSMIDILINISVERDPYTKDHSSRVALITENIGREFGLQSNEISTIKIGAQLHDIGKINVPRSILFKPGGLSELEFEMIKQHTKFGYEIIKDVNLSDVIKDIVLHHHERNDGSGYPEGLKKEEMQFETRLIAVVDVFEAMTSHRAYRPALPIEDALSYLDNNKGIMFDQEIVNCLKGLYL